MNMYVGSQMSEKELQRIQKLMSGGQITPQEKKRIMQKIKDLTGAQFTQKERNRLK